MSVISGCRWINFPSDTKHVPLFDVGIVLFMCPCSPGVHEYFGNVFWNSVTNELLPDTLHASNSKFGIRGGLSPVIGCVSTPLVTGCYRY